jgi:hypothetical protein
MAMGKVLGGGYTSSDFTSKCRIKAMGHRSPKAVWLNRLLVAHLMSLLCLVSLGFVYRGAIAQELEGHHWPVEQEKAQAAKLGSDFKECAKAAR